MRVGFRGRFVYHRVFRETSIDSRRCKVGEKKTWLSAWLFFGFKHPIVFGEGRHFCSQTRLDSFEEFCTRGEPHGVTIGGELAYLLVALGLYFD